MKTREDFEPEVTIPKSIEEIVRNELCSTTYKDNTYPEPEPIEQLMRKVYAHIEKQALEAYHSNEPWALRRWALANILKEEVVNETTVEVADGLLDPLIDWQREQPFDPIAHFNHRLTHTLRRSPHTVRIYLITATRFVGKFGRKRHYSDEEVLEYLDWSSEHFQKQSSYVHDCHHLVQFLRNLPGADRERKLPIDMPQMPDEFNQPMWSDDEVCTIAMTCVLDNINPNMVVRIAVATIFGGRRGELSQLSSDNFHLDGADSYIYIPTLKRGTKKKQPIPESLIPIFSVPVSPITPPTLHNRLKRIVEKAGVPWHYGSGFHSFRRNVVTTLDNLGTQSDISIHKFMRWSTPRHLGMLDRYRRTPTEVSDMVILNHHPMVDYWEKIIPYVVEFNRYYHSHIDILT